MTRVFSLFNVARRLTAAVVCFAAVAHGQTPPPPAKRLPPAGVAIAEADRAELTVGAARLRADIDRLANELATKPVLHALLADIEVLHKAVDWALRYDEFFDVKHVASARRLLATAHERAAQLRDGTAPWTRATGTVIRGYRSKLDGSVQPYAVTLPADWERDRAAPRRLDVVLLGRGEKRTELGFIEECTRPPRENDIFPEGAIVLRPYGRYCNATKFAGEVDVFEAMDAVRSAYPVDPDRIVVRGFSMGGASTWHLAAHHPDRWVAAAPGAGFAETPAYTKALAPGKPERTAWEQRLWRWYDVTGYAGNFHNLPVVAYSGELDPQKQAADIMARAMAAEGLQLEHLIGPQTAHKYHPESKAQLTARLAELAANGRTTWPAEDRFTTYTLRYAHSRRITIRELEQSWERADVHYTFVTPRQLAVTARNVAVFRIALDTIEDLQLRVNGQPVALSRALDPADTWLVREDGRWTAKPGAIVAERSRGAQPRKIPGLSGPVMDAFMEPFLFVRPTGTPLNAVVGRWTESELQHAVKLWRDLFRGDVRIKADTEVTPHDLASRHVVLWGDPASNRLLAKLLVTEKLPLTWDAKQLTFRGRTYDAAHHAPILVFPNPLSANQRYVVLNSGVDFRDEAYGTNALQTPKLPDFAIIDLREPPGPRWPGLIVDAGFFDETWR